MADFADSDPRSFFYGKYATPKAKKKRSVKGSPCIRCGIEIANGLATCDPCRNRRRWEVEDRHSGE